MRLVAALLAASLALSFFPAHGYDLARKGPRAARQADPAPPPSWTITPRTDLLNPDGTHIMTVPIWRPSTLNHAMALDLSPRGSPAEIGGSGFSWIDVCDKDLQAHIDGTLPQAVIYCTYTGITSAGASFGIRRFGTGPLKPVRIVTGNLLLATFKRQNGDTGAPQLIVGEFDSIAAAAAARQVAVLQRDNARLTQHLVSTQRANSVLKASFSKLEARILSLETRLRALEK